jgi:DNA-binding CsgD family transcriptional regulator
MKKVRGFDIIVDSDRSHERVLFTPQELPAGVAEMAERSGWKAALDLHTAHWDRYVATHPEALLASIKALPGEAFVELPSLLVAVNYLQHRIGGEGPRRFHDLAHDDTGQPGRERNTLDTLIASAGRTAGHRTGGRLTEAARVATEARQTLDSLTARERTRLHMSLPHLLVQWGRAFELVDQGGVREYEEAWELANLTEQPLAARRAAGSLAWLHADHGRLNEAEVWIGRARSLQAVEPRYDAPLHLSAAMVSIDRLDHAAAMQHLADLESVPTSEYWAAEAWVRAWAAQSERDAIRVERLMTHQLLGQPEGLRTAGSYGRYLTASRARLAVTRGRPSPPPPTVSTRFAFDRIMAAGAAYRAGTMHIVLREASEAMKQDPSPRLQSAALLLTAAARLGLGRKDAAAEAFRTAHEVIDAEGLFSAYGLIARAHLIELLTLTGIELASHPTAPHRDTGSDPFVALGSLTKRERQVLIHLASDLSLKAIAETLFVSPNTVKGITSGLYRKLGVHSRQEAADVAHRAGLA